MNIVYWYFQSYKKKERKYISMKIFAIWIDRYYATEKVFYGSRKMKNT